MQLDTRPIDEAVAHDTSDRAAVARLGPGQKAAVIVRLLLSEEVPLALDRLSPSHQERLARRMAELKHINRATLARVVQDFTTALDSLALTFPSGLPDALSLLEPHLSAPAREGLMAEARARGPVDAWSRLADLEDAQLVRIIESESAEVCAILLSKLGVARAATILTGLPDDRAEIIAHAVALTGTVAPEMVERIGSTLLGQLESQPKTAFKSSAVDRIGAILNSTPGATREAILQGLEKRNAIFAAQVRRAIFTFDHIPRRLESSDVPKIMRKMEPEVVVTAFAAGLAQAPLAVEFMLENMSKRLAEQLREEAEAMGTPRAVEGEAAMVAVINAIRELEEDGDLRLIPLEAEE